MIIWRDELPVTVPDRIVPRLDPFVGSFFDRAPRVALSAQLPTLQLVPPRAVTDGLYCRFGKRLLDLVLASIALVLALPLFLLVAASVRLTMGPEVVFRQRRVGRDGVDFTMYKFRTMRPSRRTQEHPFDGPDRRATHKHPLDPRHTKLGLMLRRTSLDELPQLINVLRGEMSMVGPRPEMSSVADRFGLRHHPRHSVTPGITGHWQIAARNDGKLLHECFDHDVEYLVGISFREDLRILAITAKVLAQRSGL